MLGNVNMVQFQDILVVTYPETRSFAGDVGDHIYMCYRIGRS